MVYLYPVPDAEGLEKTKEFYRRKLGRDLTDEEAYEVLNSVMRFIWLTSNSEAEISNEEYCKNIPHK